ncbi:Ig-like domain-containing protein [Halobacteriovorax sp. HLS]|uniref:Ig-like domain-containing protein n=1 Tax=Halobacteriovorax sp. HLS TaxID=2234000 RepID=UPI000FD98EAB|nr:DUF2341 domain-containing protein [Halobacteriovorax sp. HLS]
MVEKLKFIFMGLLILATMQSCKQAAESVEVEDQRRYEAPPKTAPTPPTNADLSYINSVAYITSERVYETQSTIISFVGRDSSGVAIKEGGLAVAFSLLGDGTSAGTFSAVRDQGNGVYDVTLTGTSFGSPNTIQITVGGTPIIQLVPFRFHVLSGQYYRDIDLSSPTDQDELQVKLTLNASNFDYSKAAADGSDLRFFDTLYNSQDYWIESWNTSGDSTVWVKIQNTATSKIIMSYGNSLLTSASSREAVFTYDTAKAVYLELSQAASNRNHSISSYTSLNDVTVKTSGGDVTNTISPVTPTITPNTLFGEITVLGPISGRFETSSVGSDSIMPISFASSVLGYPKSRGVDDWDLYNPNTVDANLTLYNYDSSGTLLNSFDYTVSAKSFLHIDYDVSKFGLIESDRPIVGLYYVSNSSDGAQMVPPSTDIVGPLATGASIGITQNGTFGTIYYSNGTSVGFSGNKGSTVDLSGGGNQNAATGVRVTSNFPVIANGQADSDGTDTETFWAVDELNDDYIIPGRSQYITIVCTEVVNITLDDTGPNDNAGVCTPGGPLNPGVLSFGSATALTYGRGTRVSGDANFYAYYEYETEDETNVTSWKQARSYSETSFTISIGAEQTWN